ncbi:30S ribosomal protein S8, partial [Dysosmobacter welbionis]
QQQHDLNDSHHQVDAVEDFGGVAHAAHQLSHRGSRHLRPQHVHPVAIPAHRQNGHDEHQNTHAAHPVGEAAPEQNAPVQRLHLRQDGGPRGGEAGDCLKEAIYKALYGAGDVKGQRTEEGHGNPRQRHYRQAV